MIFYQHSLYMVPLITSLDRITLNILLDSAGYSYAKWKASSVS